MNIFTSILPCGTFPYWWQTSTTLIASLLPFAVTYSITTWKAATTVQS